VARFPVLRDVPTTESVHEVAATPENMLVPFLDYDFGPHFEPNDMRGMLDSVPPRIRRVLPSRAPQIDSDGNELAGIKSPLVANPLGTYTGWNRTQHGFFTGDPCGFTGGFIPFFETRADRTRLLSRDPRPTLEERYGTHDAYVRRVRETADRLVRERFLLAEDAERNVASAEKSDVLRGRAGSPTSTEKVR